MTSPNLLLDLLHDSQINVREFEAIVMAHFGRARHLAPNAVVYPNDASDFALKITYDDDDNIQSITAGPALKDDDIPILIKQLETDVIASAGVKVGALVLFADRSSFPPSRGKEIDDLSDASSIVRVTLVNWLLLSPHANAASSAPPSPSTG